MLGGHVSQEAILEKILQMLQELKGSEEQEAPVEEKAESSALAPEGLEEKKGFV